MPLAVGSWLQMPLAVGCITRRSPCCPRAMASAGQPQAALVAAPEPEEASVADVLAWLARIGLDQYREHFARHLVDGATLADCHMDVLRREIGIQSWGHRRKICLQSTGRQSLSQPLVAIDLPPPATLVRRCHRASRSRPRP